MKRELVCMALGFVALATAPLLAQFLGRGDQDSARHGWISSLSEGKAQAKKTGKPLMAVLRCVP